MVPDPTPSTHHGFQKTVSAVIPAVQAIHAEAIKVRKEGHFGILALRLAILIKMVGKVKLTTKKRWGF